MTYLDEIAAAITEEADAGTLRLILFRLDEITGAEMGIAQAIARAIRSKIRAAA